MCQAFRIFTGCNYLGLQARVERIPERVAEKIEGEDGQADRENRGRSPSRRPSGELNGGAAEHQAPRRRRLRHASPRNESDARARWLAEVRGEHDSGRRHDVRQHVLPQDDPPVAEPGGRAASTYGISRMASGARPRDQRGGGIMDGDRDDDVHDPGARIETTASARMINGKARRYP